MIPGSFGSLFDAIVREAIDDEHGLLSRQNLFFWKATQSFPSHRTPGAAGVSVEARRRSAFALIATIGRTSLEVRKVPFADI
jgi:hypothetical protein